MLRERGETIHPASAELASENEHIDREAGEHDLHAFQALRRMDEIFCANYMLFDDVVHEDAYDLWIGDEAWEVDHFLHENPERKNAPYAWLSDFVGYLPMPSGGEHEAFLTADYNAEMIEHIERHPNVRDRAIFVGEPDDIVGAPFGPGLPGIRDWTQRHFEFAGYVPGFDPAALGDRAALRAQLGYGDEPLLVISVGGSGVGGAMLRRAVAALPALRERVPGPARAGRDRPRIDPATVPAADGLEVRGYVHELYRHLAVCDVGLVQGGLTTTMELVAAGRPFVSLPLASHFEQRYHVRHRLDRYGATHWLEYAEATPEAIADAVEAALATPPEYRRVDYSGAGGRRRCSRSCSPERGAVAPGASSVACMFGHNWEPAQATIVAVHAKSTTGDGMVTIHEFAADVVPDSGAPPFRALMQEPRIATNFWAPSTGDIVRAEADVKRQTARFDKSDPKIDARGRGVPPTRRSTRRSSRPPGTP